MGWSKSPRGSPWWFSMADWLSEGVLVTCGGGLPHVILPLARQLCRHPKVGGCNNTSPAGGGPRLVELPSGLPGYMNAWEKAGTAATRVHNGSSSGWFGPLCGQHPTHRPRTTVASQVGEVSLLLLVPSTVLRMCCGCRPTPRRVHGRVKRAARNSLRRHRVGAALAFLVRRQVALRSRRRP